MDRAAKVREMIHDIAELAQEVENYVYSDIGHRYMLNDKEWDRLTGYIEKLKEIVKKAEEIAPHAIKSEKYYRKLIAYKALAVRLANKVYTLLGDVPFERELMEEVMNYAGKDWKRLWRKLRREGGVIRRGNRSIIIPPEDEEDEF